jgi:hypothetical protein
MAIIVKFVTSPFFASSGAVILMVSVISFSLIVGVAGSSVIMGIVFSFQSVIQSFTLCNASSGP